jgi:hypothetical protein
MSNFPVSCLGKLRHSAAGWSCNEVGEASSNILLRDKFMQWLRCVGRIEGEKENSRRRLRSMHALRVEYSSYKTERIPIPYH